MSNGMLPNGVYEKQGESGYFTNDASGVHEQRCDRNGSIITGDEDMRPVNVWANGGGGSSRDERPSSTFLLPVGFFIPILILGGLISGLLHTGFMALLSLTDTVLYSSVFCFAVAVYYMLVKNAGKLSYWLTFGFLAVTGTFIPYGLSFMVGRDILSQNERWAFGMLMLTMVFFILQASSGLSLVNFFKTPVRRRLAKIIMFVLASAYTVTGVVRYAWSDFPIYDVALAVYTLLWITCVLYLWFECCRILDASAFAKFKK